MKASVILPTHNRAYILKYCIQYILNQNISDYEVIVIDDASTDNTPDLVSPLTTSHCPKTTLKYIRLDKQKGPYVARNIGIKEASGNIIAFIDDDCVATKDWLTNGLTAFSDTNLGIVQGKTEAKIDFDVKEELKKGHFFFRGVQILNAGWQYQTCNIFYRKSALIAANVFDERLHAGEDTDLGTRVKNLGYSYAFIQSALVYHNVDQISLTSYLKDYKRSQYVPLYFKKHKELREKLFWRYFWSKYDFFLTIAILSIPLGLLVSPFLLLLALPYLLSTFLRFHLVTVKMGRLLTLCYRIAMAPFSVLSDIVHISYFIIGSIRYRSIVI